MTDHKYQKVTTYDEDDDTILINEEENEKKQDMIALANLLKTEEILSTPIKPEEIKKPRTIDTITTFTQPLIEGVTGSGSPVIFTNSWSLFRAVNRKQGQTYIFRVGNITGFYTLFLRDTTYSELLGSYLQCEFKDGFPQGKIEIVFPCTRHTITGTIKDGLLDGLFSNGVCYKGGTVVKRESAEDVECVIM